LARVARERGWQLCVWEKTFSEIPHVAARRFASRVAQ
jgi:hypothetical protein